MPLIGDEPEVDIPLWVPGKDSDLNPLMAAFIMAQNSVLLQQQRLLRRMRSQVLYQDKFEAGTNWKTNSQKLRVVGEVWGYLQLTLERTNVRATVPRDGNFIPIVLGEIADLRLVPQSLAALSSVDTGRLAHGHVLASGEVKLDAINSGADIEVGDIITLAGIFPLDNWLDSGE